MEQSYERHAHHPVPTYVASVFTVLAIILSVGAAFFGWNTGAYGLVSLAFAVQALNYISRSYIVRLQDRIILLEMKVRCAEVLPAGQDAWLQKLSRQQIVALRFASDEELGDLLQRAVHENLTPDSIKRSIKNWRPDELRT